MFRNFAQMVKCGPNFSNLALCPILQQIGPQTLQNSDVSQNSKILTQVRSEFDRIKILNYVRLQFRIPKFLPKSGQNLIKILTQIRILTKVRSEFQKINFLKSGKQNFKNLPINLNLLFLKQMIQCQDHKTDYIQKIPSVTSKQRIE
ncbi:hypothetical protein pb186bvf_013739 [Paramecium bursaria]